MGEKNAKFVVTIEHPIQKQFFRKYFYDKASADRYATMMKAKKYTANVKPK